MEMTCDVFDSTACRSIVKEKCNEIKYLECFEDKKERCENEIVKTPHQEYIHKKKCILDTKPPGPIPWTPKGKSFEIQENLDVKMIGKV